MPKLPSSIAQKLKQILQGEHLPASQLKHKQVDRMLEDGVLQSRLQGRSRTYIFVAKPEALTNYLANQLGINDLSIYLKNLVQGTTRAENVVAAADSKLSARRTFKGFLVNSLRPIQVSIKSEVFSICPQEGTFSFIFDYETFCPAPETTIVGIENPENFRHIAQQQGLFETDNALFVSRYPQSKDLRHWLTAIPNKYLHFGDFDFEGIRIFWNEYRKHLGPRATFLIPAKTEELLARYGNKALYNKQSHTGFSEELPRELTALLGLFHKYKACLEQEVFLQLQ